MSTSTPADVSRVELLKRRRNRQDIKRRLKGKFLRLIALLFIFLALSLLLLIRLLPTTVNKKVKPLEPVLMIKGLKRPLSVTVDGDDNIYVGDTGNGVLAIYRSNGELIRRIGSGKSSKKFDNIFGAKVDDDTGRIYVSDWGRQSVSVFEAKGRYVSSFPADPSAAAFGPSGFTPFGLDIYKNKIYVASNDGIYIFSSKGKLLRKLGSRGDGVGQFDYPSSVAVDKKDGSIYVADQLNRRLVALSPKGKVNWMIGKTDGKGEVVSLFGLPRGVAIDSERRVYVADTFYHRVIVLNRQGKLISVIGARGKKAGQLNFPEGLVLDGQDRLLVADRENNRVQAIEINKFPKVGRPMLDKYRRSFVDVDS